MGIVDQVVEWLKAADVAAARGYPGGLMCAIEAPVAAVQLQSMDYAGQEAVVLVNVLSPAKSGAEVCEHEALLISQVLRSGAASCTVGACSYLPDPNLFCVPMTVIYFGQETDREWTPKAEPAEPEKPVFTLTMGGVLRECAVSFTAQRATDETVTQLGDTVWAFTLEEDFPLDGTEEAAPEEPFTIVAARQGRTETYTGCVLRSQKRVLTMDGLRQTRSGTATAMTVS